MKMSDIPRKDLRVGMRFSFKIDRSPPFGTLVKIDPFARYPLTVKWDDREQITDGYAYGDLVYWDYIKQNKIQRLKCLAEK